MFKINVTCFDPKVVYFLTIYLGKPNILPSTKEHINGANSLRCPKKFVCVCVCVCVFYPKTYWFLIHTIMNTSIIKSNPTSPQKNDIL